MEERGRTEETDRAWHQRLKDVLLRVLDAPPDERDAVLDAVCNGDIKLRREAESLLARHKETTDDPHGPFGLRQDYPITTEEDVDLTGSRVGAYRLERLLGRGGMGAVYLASRDDGEFAKRVAIKVIRPSMATPHLLKRFRAERQILADIEHPHIARFLDGGTSHDGLPFFIMEYVEGETLADVLRRGPVPLPRALRLAGELAGALALIHSKGLVFRDLKPSNLMVDAQSRVKVLDFGIARAARADEPATAPTAPGAVIGTPRYMSPEQAAGMPADAASDVFAFGVVLFEALTGRLPFDGATLPDYLRNLMSADARGLPPTFPRPVRQLIERCLRKSPGARYPSGGELAVAVQALGPSGRGESTRRASLWVAAVTGAVLIGSALWIGRHAPAETPAIGTSQPVVTWASNETNPRVSPDSRWISFISDRDGVAKVWLRDRTSGEERVIAAGSDVRGQEWSPASDRVAYLTTTRADTILNISDIAPNARPAVFSLEPDAVLVRWIRNGIYYTAAESLWRFDLTTQRSREVTTARDAHSLRSVDVSADERHLVFTAYKAYGSDFVRLWYADIDGKNAVALTNTRIDPRFPRWKGPGSDEFVYVSEENGQTDIWSMNILTRQRRPLTISGAREAVPGVSDDGGAVVYQQITESASLASLNPVEKTPVVKPLTADNLSDLAPSASVSGQVVSFQRAKQENLGVGIYSATVRLSRDGFGGEPEAIGEGYAPEVSPNGQWVAFLSSGRLTATSQLKIYDVQSRKIDLVSEYFAKPSYRPFPMAWTKTNLAWSPTQPALYFVSYEPGHRRAILKVTLPSAAGALRTESIVEAEDLTAEMKDLRVSSDGSYLSYIVTSASRAVSELRVVDLTRGSEVVSVTEGPNLTLTCPGWMTAETILVLRSNSNMDLVDVLEAKRTDSGGREGDTRLIGQLRRLDLGNLVLDAGRGVLYFTRTEPTGHGLHAFSVQHGGERLVRAAEAHGGVFSGLRVLGGGRILFTVQKRNSDIYSYAFGR